MKTYSNNHVGNEKNIHVYVSFVFKISVVKTDLNNERVTLFYLTCKQTLYSSCKY